MLTICKDVSKTLTRNALKAHVGAHASDEHDGPPTLRDHVARGLSRREERSMDVDIVQLFYPVERIAGNAVELASSRCNWGQNAYSKAE